MNTTIDHDNLPESFAPETVDDEIARYLSAEPQLGGTASDAHLIREIATYHALPAEADAALSRAHARMHNVIDALGDHHSGGRKDTAISTREKLDSRPQPSQQWRDHAAQSSQARRLASLSAPLRAVAAVLMVALLLGGFVAVLHLRAGRQIGASPTWQNVAITKGNAQGHALDFDPAQVEVEYAVSDVDGTIYANGGNHLWYSANGGATYQPFAISLPPVKGGPPYAVSTVPGLRGVFVSSGNQPFVTIFYAEVGDRSWRELNTSNATQPASLYDTGIPFDATDIGKAIFYEHGYGKSVQARAVGNWIFVLAGRSDGSGSTVVGTPDFGAKWYALSPTLAGMCTQFAVSPADARQLFCLTRSDTVRQTTDGGQTWTRMTNADGSTVDQYGSIWASGQATYSYWLGTDTSKPVVLARHPIGSGNWSVAATLPTLPRGGNGQVIGVSPDDTVYVVAALEGPQTRVRINALAPGTRQFTPIGNDATLTLPNSAIFFDLGDLYSGKAPAVYAHVAPSAQAPGTQPLYRLALSAADNAPQPVVTPFLTPTILPTFTPTVHGLCTSAPGDVANIQNGGYGADFDTFPQRWGASDGAAGGSAYFGRWPDGTNKVQVVDALPSNHRVYNMGYILGQTQTMTQAQGEALATSILPKDAVQVGRSQDKLDITVVYCSTALIAAFPASVRDTNGLLPHNGLVVVTYALRTDGYLFAIGFGPLS